MRGKNKNIKEATEARVSLYARCLDGGDKHGRPLEAYQRDTMYFHRANALFELRRYAEALIDYDRVISHAQGGHVWALHQRGLTHQALWGSVSLLPLTSIGHWSSILM